jgi:hypothetical protein
MWRKSNRRRISHLFSKHKKRQPGNGADYGGSNSSLEEYDSLATSEQGIQILDSTPEDKELYQQNRREKQKRYGSLRSASLDSTSKSLDNSNNGIDSIPLPAALRPLVKRLNASDEVTDEELVSILFIVRLVDALHRVAYATFLTHSFMDELRKKLHVPDLDMEIEVKVSSGWLVRETNDKKGFIKSVGLTFALVHLDKPIFIYITGDSMVLSTRSHHDVPSDCLGL